jgi:hypothetical protein
MFYGLQRVVLLLVGSLRLVDSMSFCSYWCAPDSKGLLCTRVCNDLKYHLDHIQHLLRINQQLEQELSTLVLYTPPRVLLAVAPVQVDSAACPEIDPMVLLHYHDVQTRLAVCSQDVVGFLTSLQAAETHVFTLTTQQTQFVAELHLICRGTWILTGVILLLGLRLYCLIK